LVTAITASQLSARAAAANLGSAAAPRETEQLYELGRAILLDENLEPHPPKAVTDIARIFDVEQAAIYDAGAEKTYRYGPGADEAQLREVAQSGAAAHNPEQTITLLRPSV